MGPSLSYRDSFCSFFRQKGLFFSSCHVLYLCDHYIFIRRLVGVLPHQCGFTGQDVLFPGVRYLHQDLWQSPLCWVICVSDHALTVLTALIAVSRSIPNSAMVWKTSLSIAWGLCLMSLLARACPCTCWQAAGRLRGLFWPKQICDSVVSQAWHKRSSRCPLPNWKWCVYWLLLSRHSPDRDRWGVTVIWCSP